MLGELTDELTRGDAQYMTQMAAQRFDAITEALKQLPWEVLLVIRWVVIILADSSTASIRVPSCSVARVWFRRRLMFSWRYFRQGGKRSGR